LIVRIGEAYRSDSYAKIRICLVSCESLTWLSVLYTGEWERSVRVK
jgi:hypothetical protein